MWKGFGDIRLILWTLLKFIAWCMHSWEPITNLRTKESAVSLCWSNQGFPVLHYRLCFLQCDWRREISLQKVINVNEAQGITRCHQTLTGRSGLGTRLGRRWPCYCCMHQYLNCIANKNTTQSLLRDISRCYKEVPLPSAVNNHWTGLLEQGRRKQSAGGQAQLDGPSYF